MNFFRSAVFDIDALALSNEAGPLYDQSAGETGFEKKPPDTLSPHHRMASGLSLQRMHLISGITNTYKKKLQCFFPAHRGPRQRLVQQRSIGPAGLIEEQARLKQPIQMVPDAIRLLGIAAGQNGTAACKAWKNVSLVNR